MTLPSGHYERVGEGRWWPGIAFFAVGAPVLWMSDGVAMRLGAIASAGLALVGVVAAARPKRPDVGPPPTDRETAMVRERSTRNAGVAGAIGGAFGGGIPGAFGGRRGAPRGAELRFEYSPSIVVEREFRTTTTTAEAGRALRTAVENAGVSGEFAEGGPSLLTRRTLSVVLTYSVQRSGADSAVVRVRIAERDTSLLGDSLLEKIVEVF